MLISTRFTSCCLGILLSLTGLATFAGDNPSKPSPPIHISIGQVEAGNKNTIEAEKSLELAILVRAFIELPNVNVHIDLSKGVELVAGETTWTGSLMKNETRTFIIIVRSSKNGKGRIAAHAEIPNEQGAKLRSYAKYDISGSTEKQRPPKGNKIKDSRGRDAIEYDAR